MAKYLGIRLRDDIKISKLYTVHYFEYSKNMGFTGESHDFWELVYADKGNLTIFADDKKFVLEQGRVVFHKPNEWHNVRADGVNAPNMTIITFSSSSESMRFFENKVLTVGQRQKELLSKIVSEYTNAFRTPLNDPYTTKLERRDNASTGAEQLLKLYLCEFLLLFLRNTDSERNKTVRSVMESNSAFDMVRNYMEQNLTRSLTLSDLTAYSGTNRTALERIFRENTGKSAIEYFNFMKIELAKRHLREENFNITQIAELLGYSGIHYFSRQFKKISGMTPTEYMLSIKAMIKE